jgi:glycosyltransferase involved in cell wall biosynthesis
MVSKSSPGVSVIATSYNRPDALQLVLSALEQQTQLPDEVIIADDGSTEETQQLITQLQTRLTYPLKHIWQIDQGFQAARIRNKAALQARNPYLIFIDGDCVPFPDFVAQHRQLAEPNCFVSGHRILLNKTLTQKILEEFQPIHKNSSLQWLLHYLHRDTNRLFPLLRIDLNKLRKLHPKRWQGAKSCNLAVWKKDFVTINGFDESFIGWGYEDSDLVIRLIRLGTSRKSGRLAVPVIHLWHPQNDRAQEAINLRLLKEIELSARIRAKIGLDVLA